jgi:MFS transporter, ACS family, hexuronate transporter
MRWIVLVLLFFGAVINFADKSIIGLAAAPIMKELDLSYAQWGLVGSSYYWLYPVTGVFGAAWADKIGAKKILIGLMIIWTVLQFGVLAISILPLLILYRVLLGAFEGPFSPIAYAHAHKWFPPKLRGFANSVVVSGGTVGAMIVAPLLVALITGFGWQMAFASLGAASFIWAVLFIVTKENPAKLYDTSTKQKKEKMKLKDVGLILVSPTALFTTLAYFSTYILVVWFSVWLPIYLNESIKMSATQMGLAIMLIGIASTVIYIGVSAFSDYLFKKNQNWRVSRVYVVGIAMIIGVLAMFSVTIYQNPVWVIIAMILAKGLTYTILPIGPTIMINEVPERGGLMTSILTSSGNIAGIIAPVVTGFLVGLAGGDKVSGYNLSILVIAGTILVFSVLFLLFVKPDRKEEQIIIPQVSEKIN